MKKKLKKSNNTPNNIPKKSPKIPTKYNLFVKIIMHQLTSVLNIKTIKSGDRIKICAILWQSFKEKSGKCNLEDFHIMFDPQQQTISLHNGTVINISPYIKQNVELKNGSKTIINQLITIDFDSSESEDDLIIL
jgi:hypothetical protein